MFSAESFQLWAKEDGGWIFSWRSTGFNGFTWSVSEFAFTLEFNMQEWAVAPPRREHFAAGRKQHILQDVLKCVLFYLYISFFFFFCSCMLFLYWLRQFFRTVCPSHPPPVLSEYGKDTTTLFLKYLVGLLLNLAPISLQQTFCIQTRLPLLLLFFFFKISTVKSFEIRF